MMRNAPFALLCWCCLLGSGGFAQSIYVGLSPQKAISQFQCDTWQKNQGLPQNSVFAITQSREGYLWIATYEGLARFDGSEFQSYTTLNVNELQSSGIWEVYEDSRQNLWIGTNNGGLTCYSKGKFKTFTTKDGLPTNTITAIHETPDKTLWFATKQGLVQYKAGKFKTFTTADGLSSKEITAFHDSDDGGLWIGTSRGLTKYKAGKFEDYARNKVILINKYITAIAEDELGNLWLGTQSGLVRWNEAIKHFETFRTGDGLLDDYITKLFIDSRGTLWIGTQSSGLYRIIEQYLGYLHPIMNAFTVKEGLNANSITEIFEDHEGSLWLGMNRGGLNRLRDGKFTNIGVSEGLSDNVANCIYQDREGGVWVGTVSGGVSYLNNDKKWVFNTSNGLSSNYVRSILQDKKGDIWLATYGGGVNKIVLSENSTKPPIIKYGVAEGLAHSVCRSVVETRNGDIWIGTKNGLSRFRAGKFHTYTKLDGLSDNSIVCILQDQKGNIWVGTDGYGLNCLKPSEKIEAFSLKNGLANDLIFCLYEDKEGSIWVGTKNGLSRYKNGKFVSIQAREGLSNEAIHSITEDELGRMWFSCNSGVFWTMKTALQTFLDKKLAKTLDENNKEKIVCTFYQEEDGMKSSDCAASTQPAVMRDKLGYLWYPTTSGVAIINPSFIRTNIKKPNVVIKGFKADNIEYNVKEPINLKAGTSKFEIDFTALSFLAPTRNQYRYKLIGAGYKEEWIIDKNKHSAYYTNLPPGEYKFIVQATNNDGLWNETGVTFEFYLRPYYYQTWLFWIFSFAMIIFIAYIAYAARIYALEKRQIALQNGIISSTATIREQYREITRQADELKTIDNIVRVINQEVKFENVLKTLLEQGISLFPQANAAIFLLFHPEKNGYLLGSSIGYGEVSFPPKLVFPPDDVKNYYEVGIKVAEDLYILQPALYIKRLVPAEYRPKSSLALLIRSQERVEGIIFFDNASGFKTVPEADLQKLERFKEHAVTAFAKALILREVEIKTEQIESAYRKISDSIRYASRIQQAILPKKEEIESNFADSFIFYRPRDIVSGDFYWYAETVPEPIYAMEKDRDGKLTSVFTGFTDVKAVLAVVDCTGHGVPGAFMTVIGNDLLTAIVVEDKIDKAQKILERLDKNVKMYLKQEGNQQGRDGMDMALIVIDTMTNTIDFSGAKNPLYHFRNGELTEIKGAKYPIGGAQIQRKVFETQTIPYMEGDIFYMFTDGFPDQFGGFHGEDHKYGTKRFRELVKRIHTLPMAEQHDTFAKEMDAWQSGNKQTDDMLIMGIKM